MGAFEFEGLRVLFTRNGSGPYTVTAWVHKGYEAGAGRRIDISGTFPLPEIGYAIAREYVSAELRREGPGVL